MRLSARAGRWDAGSRVTHRANQALMSLEDLDDLKRSDEPLAQLAMGNNHKIKGKGALCEPGRCAGRR
jgi:hypothetical protein